jgi:cellulose biosynthesis protein BcsQ
MSASERRTQVIATYNIKGGVGKTSTAVNLAYLAAREGHPTLLWDLDPQAASTYLFRVRPKVKGGGRGLLKLRTSVEKVVKATDHQGLDLLPADFSYRHLDLALDNFKKPAQRLGRVLAPLREEYDYVFLDCPPSISLVSESVFQAADALLVPIIPATLSSRTYEQLEQLASKSEHKRGEGPKLLAFFSMVDPSRPLHREVMARVRAIHGLTLLGAAVPSSLDVELMGERRNPVAVYAPRSRAAISYQALWWETKRRLAALDAA